MEDEVGGPLISRNVQQYAISSYPNLHFESTEKNENIKETDDILKNGILIENSTGTFEYISLTEALSSGVGGLNLSVDDFRNVAAQLLITQRLVSNSIDLKGEISLSSASEDISSQKLESIAEVSETTESEAEESKSSCKESFKKIECNEESHTTSTVNLSESTNSDSSIQSLPKTQVKKKGGWPKGRKRKPESETRPPKAPSTGYVFYLNEKRKQPNFKNVPFHEVTKILGNEWSNLDLEEKKSYLERAEEDKKRYKEELKVYRNSEAYQAYLRRKRIKSFQANGTEESDIDATDEIEEEDSEELYCRVCDQWFITLHNKKEHLLGRMHFQAISQFGGNRQRLVSNVCSSLSLEESSLDATPLSNKLVRDTNPSVNDAMTSFMLTFSEREKEIMFLQKRLRESCAKNAQLIKEQTKLKRLELELIRTATKLKEENKNLQKAIFDTYGVHEADQYKHFHNLD
uniref:HMG box domain-containing protein n=1 Tax=Clastoptera arizonana TaxID=38151 RepID=A0A1B6E5K8_9HEMI